MTRKLFFTLGIAGAMLLTGCQQAQTQADKIKTDVLKSIDQASQQVEDVKKQVIDTKSKVEEKVTQAKEAADAVNKLVN